MTPEWRPVPLATDDVTLPLELEALVELLAENAHDNWGAQRLAEGWTHGEQRNDAARKHPDLVPYERLSDGEKAYDRLLATQTLKVILKLGFRIASPG
jgi:hypothetical protein